MTADDKIHRCGECGAWCYANDPCATCELVAEREHREAS